MKKDYDYYFEQVSQNKKTLFLIPYKYLTKELCYQAVKNNKWNKIFTPFNILKTINKKEGELKLEERNNDYNYWLNKVQQNGLYLQHVPNKFKDTLMNTLAVTQNGLALQYVPEELKTIEICKFAILQNKTALTYIPISLKEHSIRYHYEKFVISTEFYKLQIKQYRLLNSILIIGLGLLMLKMFEIYKLYESSKYFY